ncbi:MAG: hypothetical protein U0Q04_08985 [Microbacterium sp.]
MTTTPRPIGVTIVAVLLFVTGIIGVIAGIGGLVAGVNGTSAVVEGTAVNNYGVAILGGWLLLSGILSIVLAFGILRGNRVARIIVTILQILNLVSFVTTLVQGGATWAVIVNGILQIAILALLWVGDQTKAFFARR